MARLSGTFGADIVRTRVRVALDCAPVEKMTSGRAANRTAKRTRRDLVIFFAPFATNIPLPPGTVNGGTMARGMRGRLGMPAVAALLLTACNQSAPVALPHLASPARHIVAAPEFGDQPSFAYRTAQIPPLTPPGPLPPP